MKRAPVLAGLFTKITRSDFYSLRRSATALPLPATAWYWPTFIQKINKVGYILNIDYTIAVGIAGTDMVRCRLRPALIQEIYQIRDILDIMDTAAVGIPRFAEAGSRFTKILPETGVEFEIGGTAGADSRLRDGPIQLEIGGTAVPPAGREHLPFDLLARLGAVRRRGGVADHYGTQCTHQQDY